MNFQTEPCRRYFTENWKKITAHATIADGYIPSVMSITIADGYIPSVFDRELWIFTAHATVTDGYSVGKYRWKHRQTYSVGKILAGNFIFFARFAVCKTVGVWFFYYRQNWRRNGKLLTIKIPMDRFCRWILLTVLMPHTDGPNPSVKLFNGVVISMTHLFWLIVAKYFFNVCLLNYL